jgi:hypothetical protein
LPGRIALDTSSAHLWLTCAIAGSVDGYPDGIMYFVLKLLFRINA